jgi:hypothetical protein
LRRRAFGVAAHAQLQPSSPSWQLDGLTTPSSGRRSIACALNKRCGAGAAEFRR